jgi:hypothetical protein
VISGDLYVVQIQDECIYISIICSELHWRNECKYELNSRHLSIGDDTKYLPVYYRVNLIGEHVDYCGYSVLPMAIQYDVLMAVKRISEPQLYLTNMDSNHSDFHCPINSFRYVSISNYNS